MKSSLCIILLAILAHVSLRAQDSLLIQKIRSASYPIDLDNGDLGGPGLEYLNQKAQNSSFFLVGESHGMAEVPKFTAALFRTLNKQGFKYYATEVGPFTANYLDKTVKNKNYLENVSSFLESYPWSFPFFNLKEEWEVLTEVNSLTKDKGNTIWGLDQEFAASFRMNFKYLADNAENEESKQVAKEYYELTMSLYSEFVKTGNPTKSFLAVARPSDFSKLRNSFKGQKINMTMVKEIEESIKIYQLWASNQGYKSNLLRAEMMKNHFREYYSMAKELDPDPKVMLKFGSNHMYRGLNNLNVLDLGNYISEIANQQKTKSFHLLVLGGKGTVNSYNLMSKSQDDKRKKYDALEYSDKWNAESILNSVEGNSWSLIDLKPIKESLFNRSIKVDDDGLERIIWSYDAILVIPKVSASTLINDI